MSNDLHRHLHDLADEMNDTNYSDLRQQVDRTSRRIGRRRALAIAAAGFVAVAAVTAGGYALATRHTSGPAPATSPTATPTEASPTPTSSPSTITAIPGTLVYVSVQNGQITVTTVTDGVAHQTTFGPPTGREVLIVPSPDATRLAVIDSPDRGFVKPGDLVIISAGGARHTIATNVGWGGGVVPVWMPDGQHVIAAAGAIESNMIDVNTGKATPAQPAEGNLNYLTWSANGQWRAYGLDTDVVVTAPDGSGKVTTSIGSLPECHETAGCPTSVQAVSDDGRYVALGHIQTDPTHVDEAHLVLDMLTGKLVDLPPRADRVYFRPDGGMIVRTVNPDATEYTLVLIGPDGSTIATFPDTQGMALVAYHP
jgi:hypothetical protein